MLICIDPGHGGRDPGAVGLEPYELHEDDVAWSVSTATAAVLERLGRPHIVTRSQREYVSPGARARFANEQRAAAFVSVHCNAHGSPNAAGFEVLHYPGSRRGATLASAILGRLAWWVPGPNRGLKPRANLSVLSKTAMPAVLVELPFISNPAELQWLANLKNQAAAGRSIAAGVDDWIRTQ